MDSRIIELLSEEIRETKKLTLAVREETLAVTFEIRKIAEAALLEAKASKRQADACWELVIITREESKQANRPFWKKWLATV